MTHQIEFPANIGEDNFPVLVRVSVHYEGRDWECGIAGGWVCEFDEAVKDEERWTPEHGEMPAVTHGQIERWETKAAEVAENDAQATELDWARSEAEQE